MHIPVLTDALLEAIAPRADALYLDGTVGFGGHAKAILESAPGSCLCGLDRDLEALEFARFNLSEFANRTHLFNMNFSSFDIALQKLDWDQADGAILDLGVSSFQIDTAERGFSFLHDGPLDMRMNPNGQQKSAWHLVNQSSFETLKEIISTFGEEPLAGRIARAIVDVRQKKPICTTGQLAEIVMRAYPASRRAKARKHPATRTFQALRVAVNHELEELEIFLDKILKWLKPGGRLAIISFHSLEDRIVKRAMQRWARGCICPPHVMECKCNHKPEARIIFRKPIEAAREEMEANPRSGSAKLRAIEKISVNN